MTETAEVETKAVAILTGRAGRLGDWSPVGHLGTGHAAAMMTGQPKVVGPGHRMTGLKGKDMTENVHVLGHAELTVALKDDVAPGHAQNHGMARMSGSATSCMNGTSVARS